MYVLRGEEIGRVVRYGDKTYTVKTVHLESDGTVYEPSYSWNCRWNKDSDLVNELGDEIPEEVIRFILSVRAKKLAIQDLEDKRRHEILAFHQRLRKPGGLFDDFGGKEEHVKP